MGLGNPGLNYEKTLHNVGYHVVDMLMNQFSVNFKRKRFTSVLQALIPGDENNCPVMLFRWMGFMNESGRAVTCIRKNNLFSIDNLYIILDNMDLASGICRLKTGGGNAGHNGLKSVIAALGSPDFNRLYIGIGRPEPGIDVIDHLLDPTVKTYNTPPIEQACQQAVKALLDFRTKKI